MRTSFKTLVSKKATTWQLKKYWKCDNFFMKISVFELSHGIKNIYQGNLHLESTHWRNKNWQLLLLKVCDSFRFAQSKNTDSVLWSVLVFFTDKIRPSKYCLREVNLIFFVKIFSLMCQDVNLIQKIVV